MSILNRLKKIESQIVRDDPNFCSCDKENTYHLLVPNLNYPNGAYCETCRGVCSFDPDAACDKCGKPVLSEIIKPQPRKEMEPSL